MSILTLPSLIKQIYKTTSHHTKHHPCLATILNRYKGVDWMEHMVYSFNNSTTTYCLYDSDLLSLNLIGISNHSKFFLDPSVNYHIKVLDGKLKFLPPSYCLSEIVETISILDSDNNNDEKWWLENSFVDHTSALVVSRKEIRML